ncbi:hypothetical protein BDP27DRAFT_1164056, partial [Rhodocollybia butyracea]
LVDRSDRIIMVLGGVPPGARGPEWQELLTKLNAAVRSCSNRSTFAAKETSHFQGNFCSRATGISYGGGCQVPGNVESSGVINQEEMQKLMLDHNMQRVVVGCSNSLFNAFGHKTFCEYKDTLKEHIAHDSCLHPMLPSTVFAATTINFGPQTSTPPYLDAANAAHGWCTDTAAGEFDPDKGGHLVLWNLNLVICFPPGSTILFPSALIMHSNIPVSPHETCYSIVQYSAGSLFCWRYNGWQSDK